jgi:hypothetical protein
VGAIPSVPTPTIVAELLLEDSEEVLLEDGDFL